MKKAGAVLFAILLLGTMAAAQEQYGYVRGVVFDESGAPLPGVTVTLTSDLFGTRTLQTSEGGVFRFLNLPVGTYRVKCELAGFKTHVQENIDLRVGVNVDFKVIMNPAAVEEEVTVVAVSPIVDMKKTGTSTQFNEVMLQQLPSARDPWVIIQQAPGVVMSQENVGGSQSGQQSGHQARGALGWSDMWNLDGIPVTDMEALGGSSFYYDFDTFEEIQIVTGGEDVTLQTGGTAVNMITRRGGNKFQVLARTFFTNDNLQGDNRTQELKDLGYVGNRIERIVDYGFQLGGPVIKDKFWFWLGYGVQDIRTLTISDYPDNTKIQSANAKLNFQFSRKNRAEVAFMWPNKLKTGRGASPTWPPECSFDQKPLGFNSLLKFEDQHMFSNNFMMSAKLAYRTGGFQYAPQGGMDVQPGNDWATGIWKGSSYSYSADRPYYFGAIEGNAFQEQFLGGSHEFRFGVNYRRSFAKTKFEWAGGAIKYYWEGAPIYAEVTRQGYFNSWADLFSVFVSDTYTKGRFTFMASLRLDREDASNKDASVEAGKVAPDLLPAMTYPGVDPGVLFVTLSPRLGFTFDITGDGKTVLRASAARYGSQEGLWTANTVSASSDAGAGYEWVDANGDDTVTTDELLGYPLDGIQWWWGFDPYNPGALEGVNAIDPNLKVELTDELIVGLEREFFPDFSLGANFILRRNHRFMGAPYYDKATQTKITQDDYVGPIAGALNYGGQDYNYEYWALADYRPAGVIVEQLPDYHENYTGFEVTAVKRLSHKWMLNASFTYQTHNVHFGPGGYYDPTNVAVQDGARSPLLNADWMAKLSFLYQLPWGLNLSGFGNIRQGLMTWQFIRVSTPERATVGLGSTMDLYTESPGQTRLETFYNFDLSLTKDIRLKNAGMLTLLVDVFNTFNLNHALSRYAQVNSTRHNEIQETLNPRVIRFGIRYSY